MRGRPPSGKGGRPVAALVTGASSGIGRSYAAVLAAEGFDVVAVARRADRLSKLQSDLEGRWPVGVYPLVADLADVAAPNNIVEQLADLKLQVGYLVNNAGYGMKGQFIDVAWERHREFLQVLALSPIELTRLLAPAMVENRWGRIVNVASVACGFSGTPGMTLYSGVKSMVLKFSEGLAAELAPSGVRCMALLPGYTATEFWAGPDMGEKSGSRKSLVERTAMSPEVVARQAYNACEHGHRSVVSGWPSKVMYALAGHSPKALRYLIADRSVAIL